MATLLELRTRIRQRTDNEHTGDFVSDTELNGLINIKVKEFYELLVLYGLQRTESSYDYSPNGSANYPLPADYFATLAVFRQDQSGAPHYYLTRHDHRVYPDTAWNAPAQTYRVVGSNIEFNPVPDFGTYTLKYVPVPADLSADGDTLDGVLGWDEYVVVAVSIDVLAKEESDTTRLERELLKLEARIKKAAGDVEISEAPTIANTRPSALSPSSNWPRPGDFPLRGYRSWPF